MSGEIPTAGHVTNGRILGLDAWRAALMMGGLLVHGSLGLPPLPLFTIVADVSEAFRMGVFFAISGFLASVTLMRRPVAGWLRNRLRQLGIPAVFGLLVLSPLIWLLCVANPAPDPGPPPLLFEWHHLWFLFGLIDYLVPAVLLHEADRRMRLIERLDQRSAGWSGRALVLAVALAGGLLFGATLPVILLLPPAYIRGFGHVQMIVGYLPMFLFGFVLARADGIRDRMTGVSRFAWAVLLATVAASVATHVDDDLGFLAEHVRFIAAVLCPPATLVLVLRSALTIRRVPAWVRNMSEASYTIYILHFPISLAVNTQMPWQLSPYLIYPFSVCAAGAVSIGLHVLLVRRVPLFALLLNGKVIGRLNATGTVMTRSVHCGQPRIPHGASAVGVCVADAGAAPHPLPNM